MTKKLNPKQKELRRVTAFLIMVSVVLIAAIAAVVYFNGKSVGDVYSDKLDYTSQTNFSYDLTKVKVDRNGATLKNNNDRASIILLNPLRISDKYQGDIIGRILEFEEVADKSPGAEIYYQLSGDGQRWQYYKNNKWQDVGSCSDCYNTAVEVNANIQDFLIESDALSVKTLLVSSDDKKPTLETINLKIKGEDCSAINRRMLSADYVGAASELWDKSSLSFRSGCSGDCEEITALVCNGDGSKDMAGPTNYEVYYKASGNPKDGIVISSGQIPALRAGQCHTLSYTPTQDGNYMFKAYQRPGHPGSGELWSNACEGIDMSECEEPYCGDGNLDQGEQCDDGNNNNGDGCDAQCAIEPYCGDGNLDSGEQCDDGNNSSGDGCDAQCVIEPYCGDGNLDQGEQCDDGNNNDGDGCSAQCTKPEACNDYCNDSIGCDNNLICSDNLCRNNACTEEGDCICPLCGDGNLDDGEQCDDGNNIDGDGCSVACSIEIQPYCGDGNLDQGEQCDDGNNNNNDECKNNCTLNTHCGNGIVEEGEECDDGNSVQNDGCNNQCEINQPICHATSSQQNPYNIIWVDENGRDSGNVDHTGHPNDIIPITDLNGDGEITEEDCVYTEQYCGDGNLDGGEECDDGNNNNGDGCDAQCTIEPYCGDGNLDSGEQCDDGNNSNGDGCDAQCVIEPYCGDGELDEGEQCDDGNNNNGDGCDAQCTIEPYCGDGNLDSGEQCDDGNNSNGDGCNAQCSIEPYFGIFLECVDPDEDGDGYLAKFGYKWDGSDPVATERSDFIGPVTDINPPQTFDPGRYLYDVNVETNGNLVWTARISNNTKTTTANESYFKRCTLEPACGNGILESNEQCDDGNNTDGDGCSASCETEVAPYCGDGIVEEGEQCDDGNNNDGDGCNSQCTVEEVEPFCGDNNLDEGEQCDDGNNNDGDGCSAQCSVEPFCGDGKIDDGEECDDGNDINNDYCSNECKIVPQPYCGDGNLDDGEQCDDGNTINGDGCSNICTKEPTPNCGDGNLDEGEQCDDGNNVNGDSCSAICETEAAPFCGDGNLDDNEQCDDGNTLSGDGCDTNCNNEPVPLVVPTNIVIPVPASPAIVPDVIGFNTGACGVKYSDENITFSGFLNGNYDANTILEYSLTGGLSYRPIQNVQGLGTGAATFQFTLSDYPSGTYNLEVRARLADGSIVGSVNCPFSIDLGDLIFGANEFVLSSQQGPMINTGLIEFRKDEAQRLWIEAKGATSFIVNAYKNPDFENIYKTFTLEYDATDFRKLWTGMLEFSETGVYRLVGIINGPGGTYSREINSILVTEGAEIIDEVTLTVYEKKINKVFEVWNGSAYGQANPYISEGGRFSFILPEGEYYIRASRAGYATLTSRITKISDQSLVTAEIDMQKWTLLRRITSLFNRGPNNFDLEVAAIPKFELLNVGDLMESINGVNSNGERYELLGKMGNNNKVLMVYSDWNREAQEQADNYIKIVMASRADNNNLSFAALGTMPPLNTMRVFNERGGYDYDSSLLNFFKPEDIFHENYMSISLPHFYVLGPDNRLKGTVVGSYPPSELLKLLLDIANQ